MASFHCVFDDNIPFMVPQQRCSRRGIEQHQLCWQTGMDTQQLHSPNSESVMAPQRASAPDSMVGSEGAYGQASWVEAAGEDL